MKFIVAVLAGMFGATSALAADLPAPVYTKAPVYVDPGYNWTGFYLGTLASNYSSHVTDNVLRFGVSYNFR